MTVQSGHETWTWGDLFQLQIPPELAVSDREHAAEFVPRRRVGADEGSVRSDEREAARAWLSVFGPEPRPAEEALVTGIVRFAATVNHNLTASDIGFADAHGLSWGRADFVAVDGESWQVIGVAWSGVLALFMIVGGAGDPEFAAGMDKVLASFRALDAVVLRDLGPEPDGEF